MARTRSAWERWPLAGLSRVAFRIIRYLQLNKELRYQLEINKYPTGSTSRERCAGRAGQRPALPGASRFGAISYYLTAALAHECDLPLRPHIWQSFCFFAQCPRYIPRALIQLPVQYIAHGFWC